MPLESKLNLEEKTLKKLQSLIQINIDSEEGLTAAANKVDDNRLSATFRQVGQTRSSNVHELQSYVVANAQEPEDGGSAMGALHRGWTSMRSAINGGDPYVMLIEAERGEDHIKETYEDVLKETAGSAVNDVLQRQYASVKKGHDLIRDLRDAYKQR